MHKTNEDLGHSVIKALMNFKRAELGNFHIDGYSRAEIRFLFMIYHGMKRTDNAIGVRVADVSKMLRVSKPSVTQQINALEKKGLIERIQNPEDKRAAYLRFTAQGEKVIKEVIRAFTSSFTDMQDYLGVEDMNKLIELLEKLTDYLNNKRNKEV